MTLEKKNYCGERKKGPVKLIKVNGRETETGERVFEGRNNALAAQSPWQSSKLCCNCNFTRAVIFSLFDESDST